VRLAPRLRRRTLPRHALHLRSIDRHARWARDYALAGDLEAAVEALVDLRALASEFEPNAERDATDNA
jgi:hypothetical protein